MNESYNIEILLNKLIITSDKHQFFLKLILSHYSTNIYEVSNEFLECLNIKPIKKYVIRLSSANSIVFYNNNILLYAGKRDKHLSITDNYYFNANKQINNELLIQKITYINNLSPEFLHLKKYHNKGRSKLMIMMEEIESKYFLNNIFKINQQGKIFNPPTNCTFQILKKLFYDSMNKLHSLGIIHNDLIYINSLKRNIHNSYYDNKDNTIKFIDFSLSYYAKNEGVDLNIAVDLEKEHVNNFFNDFEQELPIN